MTWPVAGTSAESFARLVRVCRELKRTGLPVIYAILVSLMAVGCARRAVHPRPDNNVPARRAASAVPKLPALLPGLRLDTVTKPAEFTEDNLWEHMDGGANEIIRLGFEQLIVAYYRQPGADREVRVEAFYMKTPGAAASLFDAWRSKKAGTGSVCGRSQAEGSALSWQKDRTYVQLSATFNDSTAGAVLEGVARDLCAVLSSP